MVSLVTITAEANPQRIITTWHPDVENLSSQTDISTGDLSSSPAVLQADQLLDHFLWVGLLTDSESEMVLLENLGWVQSVDY